jgi:hypothetical protein
MANTDLRDMAWHIDTLAESEPEAQVVILSEAQTVVDNLSMKNRALQEENQKLKNTLGIHSIDY